MKRLPEKRHSRAAFTLLELLLAAAISSLVLAGVGGLILIVYRIEATSDESVYLRQAGRNLLRQLERDLTGIPAILPVEESEESGTSSEGMILALDDGSGILEFETETSTATYDFTGDTVSLVFSTSSEARTGVEYSVEELYATDPTLKLTKSRQVYWGFTEADLADMTEVPANSESIVARQEGFIDPLEETTIMGDQIMMPQMLSMEFQYFDGTDWVESWDASTMGGLPKAVEATLLFQLDSDSLEQLSLKRTIQIPAARFQVLEETSESSLSLSGE